MRALANEKLHTCNNKVEFIKSKFKFHNGELMAEPMLPFELSAIDIVLVLAVGVLIILFLSQKPGQPTNKSEIPTKGDKKPPEKPKVPSKNAQEKLSETQPSTDSEKCLHNFGYLKNLPKNTSVPDECYGCPKLMRCLFPNE